MYTGTFQSGLLIILKMIMNLNCLFVLLIFSIHISGPATVQNQNLSSAYMYIYCHVVNF